MAREAAASAPASAPTLGLEPAAVARLVTFEESAPDEREPASDETGAEAVAVGNVGCILQIARQVKERGDAIEVAHPVDLLDRAYGPIPAEG